MKISKFLLILFFIFSANIQKSFSDDDKMIKGLEIFNEIAGCAGCHILKAAGSEGNVGPNLDTVSLTEDSVKVMDYLIYLILN